MMKILALSCSRADYDLMSPLYRLLQADPDIELKLLVAGAHLSPSYGYTVDAIKRDGIPILATIESLIDSDSNASRLKTASILMQNSIDWVVNYHPDLILYVGDREEVMVGALLGGYLEIPTIHFWGGDHATDGYIDNPVRHACSKLSSCHFVTLPQHAERLQRIGEPEQRIFYVGNMALDRFVDTPEMTREQLAHHMPSAVVNKPYAVVIYHPIFAEKSCYVRYFKTILQALKQQGLQAVISTPNTDPGNKQAHELIQQYHGDPAFYFYQNLPREIFVNAYRHAEFIIGNSSSGIIEAASLPIAAINVGLRQSGRYAEHNVIFCEPELTAINNAIAQVQSIGFQQTMKTMINPYGDGKSAERAFQLIKRLPFKEFLYKSEDPLMQEKADESPRYCTAS